MMRPRTTLLMGTVYRGEYVVDPRAVADAMVKRGLASRRSPMLETAEVAPDRSVRSDERDSASRRDLP